MDEGNVGKDLAIQEKQKFEEEVLKIVENLKADGKSITLNGIQYTYVKGNYTMKLAGTDIEFGIIDKDGKFSYNKEKFIEAKKTLQEQGIDLEELGLPNIEEWIDEKEEMEQEQAKEDKEPEEQEKDEEQKDEEDLSDDMEEKDNEEQDRTEEIAKKYNVNSNRVTHVSLTRIVAGRETLPELDSKTKGYKDVYVIPGKDSYSRTMIGIDKDGREEEIERETNRGRVPDINIKLIEEDKITDKIKPYEYWPINNKEGMAVIRDSVGRDMLIYCRQEEGRGKEFQGIIVPEADTKNIDSNPKEVRDTMDYRQNSAKDLADRADRFEKQKEYEEELGAPSVGGRGVQSREVISKEQQKKENIKACKEDLMQRDGVSLSESLKRNAMPGYYEKVDADYQRKAEEVYRLVAEEEMPYEDAVRRVKANDREQGGNTPDQNPRKREM